MDVFYFEPRDPFSPSRQGRKGERIKGGRRDGARKVESGGEKVEEARGDGLAGANHLVCIHLRRILFLRSLLLPSTVSFFFFPPPILHATTLSYDSSPRENRRGDKRAREREKNHYGPTEE